MAGTQVRAEPKRGYASKQDGFAAPPEPQPTLDWVLNQMFSHTLFVGLPIALAISGLARSGATGA